MKRLLVVVFAACVACDTLSIRKEPPHQTHAVSPVSRPPSSPAPAGPDPAVVTVCHDLRKLQRSNVTPQRAARYLEKWHRLHFRATETLKEEQINTDVGVLYSDVFELPRNAYTLRNIEQDIRLLGHDCAVVGL
jgi:hypothetical protein